MYLPQKEFLLFYEQVYWLQFGRYFARGPIVSHLRLVFQEDFFRGKHSGWVPSVHMLCEPQPTACDTIYSNILPDFSFLLLDSIFCFFIFYWYLRSLFPIYTCISFFLFSTCMVVCALISRDQKQPAARSYNLLVIYFFRTGTILHWSWLWVMSNTGMEDLQCD